MKILESIGKIFIIITASVVGGMGGYLFYTYLIK